MSVDHVAEVVRDGKEPLRPIIEYFSEEERDVELSRLISDKEINASILYMISELPSIHVATRESIEKAVELGLNEDALVFATDILENSRVRM